jgi:hypothetical protein
MAVPVNESTPPSGPSTEVFFRVTAGLSGASIQSRQELRGGSPIFDVTLASLQGATITFGMPGTKPVSFRLPAELSRTKLIDPSFALFEHWVVIWTAGRISILHANGHWIEKELPAFMRTATVTGEWHNVRLTGLRHVQGKNWAAIFLILV